MADLVGVARAVLIAVFFVAGWAKLGDLGASREAVRGFGVPERLSPVVGIVLPAVEVAIAVALAASTTARFGAIAAGSLLVAFVVGIAANIARGNRPDCNCFGQVHSAPIGPATLVRNVALLGVAALIAIQGPGHFVGSWIERSGALGLIALSAAVVVAVLGWFVVNLTAQQGQLIVRIEELESLVGLGPDRSTHDHDHDPQSPTGLPVGTPAPVIEAPSVDGRDLSLRELASRGLPVVVVFSSANCGACLTLVPEVAEWDTRYAGTLSFLVVGTGDVDINVAKFQAAGVRHAIAREHDLTALSYRYNATPAAVLVSPTGEIASAVVVGPDAIRDLVRSAAETRRPLDRSHT